MLFVGGVDRPVIDAVVSALDAHDLKPQHIEGEDLEPENLFHRLFGSRSDFVLIDSVTRLGARPEPVALQDVIRSAAAADVSKLVVVTSRARSDPALLALRRSGVTYDILHVGRLIEVSTETAARCLSSPRVILSRELLDHASGGVLMADIVDAVVRSVRSDDAGVTLEIEPGAGDRSLMTLLQQVGAKPCVGGARAALWKLLGKPRLELSASGLIEIHTPNQVEKPFEEPIRAIAGG